MAAIETYDDVRGLDDVELRRLLEDGRPEQRVWAIWALALRSAKHAGAADRGNPTVEELAHRQEPDPGVRRNLAVVLAGHGQLDLLVALARRDPAPEVRAAAMQLATRFAIDGKLPPSLVIERGTSDTAEVRMAILGTVFAGAPRWLVELALRLLEDREADVRFEAFEALLRAGDDAPALLWLEEIPEAEARITLMRWSARSPGTTNRIRQCAETLAPASRRLRRLFVESVRVATWRDLAPVIGDEPGLIRALARRDATAFTEIPLTTLLHATLREPSDAWIFMIRDRIAALSPEGDPYPDADDLASLLHGYRELCARRISELDTQLEALHHNAESDDDHGALQDTRTAFEAALEDASRLLVH